MNKKQIIDGIEATGVVAVLRANSGEEALRITDACLAGGICAVEITFTVPEAETVIATLAKKHRAGSLLLGAGTVLNRTQAEAAVAAGAQFIVSPFLDEETVRYCSEKEIPVMPGVMTVREAMLAMNAGADILKIFPADLFGPAIIRDIHGPLPQLKMMPTGGVTADNAADWIRAGAVAVGAGSSLTRGAKTGDYAAVTLEAQRFIENIRQARKEK